MSDGCISAQGNQVESIQEQVTSLYRDTLRDGNWQSEEPLQELIPADLAIKRVATENPRDYEANWTAIQYGRYLLFRAAIKTLESSGDYEFNTGSGKLEIRLKPRDICNQAGNGTPVVAPQRVVEPAQTPMPGNCGDTAPGVTASEPLSHEPVEPGAGPQADPVIDSEFSKLHRPLTEEEFKRLKENLLHDGVCHDPIVIWKGHNILLDGHHRLSICKEHNIPYRTTGIELPDRDSAKEWVIQHQLGKRNLSKEWASYFRGHLYNSQKQSHGGDRTVQGASYQTDNLKTCEELAKKYQVSSATISRNAKFANDVDAIAVACGHDFKQAIISGEAKISRKDLSDLARMEPEIRKAKVTELIQEGKKPKVRKVKANKEESNPEPDAATATTEALPDTPLPSTLAQAVPGIDPVEEPSTPDLVQPDVALENGTVSRAILMVREAHAQLSRDEFVEYCDEAIRLRDADKNQPDGKH